jgi:hypothetical protein
MGLKKRGQGVLKTGGKGKKGKKRKGEKPGLSSAPVFPGDAQETMAKPVFIVILNGVKDLKSLEMRDSSLRSE